MRPVRFLAPSLLPPSESFRSACRGHCCLTAPEFLGRAQGGRMEEGGGEERRREFGSVGGERRGRSEEKRRGWREREEKQSVVGGAPGRKREGEQLVMERKGAASSLTRLHNRVESNALPLPLPLPSSPLPPSPHPSLHRFLFSPASRRLTRVVASRRGC